MGEPYKEQSCLPRDNLRSMGQIRSKSVLTDTIRQVNAIYTSSHQSADPDDNDLLVQAGALSVAGAVRFKGGFIDDSLSVASDAFTVGFFSETLSVGQFNAATAVKIPPSYGADLSVGYVLKAASADGHLMWAPDASELSTAVDLTVLNNVTIGNNVFIDNDLSVGSTITGRDAFFTDITTNSISNNSTIETNLLRFTDMSGVTGVLAELSVGRLTIGNDAIVFDDIVDFASISVGNMFVQNLADVNTLTATTIDTSGLVVDDLNFTQGVSGVLSVSELFADTIHGLSVEAQLPLDATFDDVTVNNRLITNIASIDSLDASGITFTNGVGGTLSISDLFVDTIHGLSVTGGLPDDATFDNVTVDQTLIANIADVESLDASGITFIDGVGGTLSISDLFVDTIHGLSVTGGLPDDATFDNVTVDQTLIANFADIETLDASGVTFNDASGGTINLTNAFIGYLTLSDGNFNQAFVQSLSVGSSTFSDLTGTTGTFVDLNADELDVRGNAKCVNLLVENNLTVQGHVTAVSTEQLVVEDHRIELGAVSSFLPVTTFLVERCLQVNSQIFLSTQHGVTMGTNTGMTQVPSNFFVHVTDGITYMNRMLVMSLDRLSDGFLSTGGVLSTAPPYPLSAGGLMTGTGLDLNQLDWITAVANYTPNVNGQYSAPFYLPDGSRANHIWCTNLFRPSQLDANYRFSSATHSVTINSITQVLSVGTTSGGSELYSSTTPAANHGFFVYLIELEPTVINTIDIEDGIEVNIAQFINANAIGGGVVIKGETDKTIEYVRTSEYTPEGVVGALPSSTCPYAPTQLSGFLFSEDLVLSRKKYAHESTSVGGHFLDSSPRSNAIHLGDMQTHHWIMCAAWPASIACGLHTDEDDAPKLQFWWGSDVFDDSSIETQEIAGTRLAFEISAPVTIPTNANSSAYAGYSHPPINYQPYC